jgi:hypothetical protein
MVGRRGEAPAGPTLQVPPYGSLACRIGAPICLSRLCGFASDAPATLLRYCQWATSYRMVRLVFFDWWGMGFDP